MEKQREPQLENLRARAEDQQGEQPEHPQEAQPAEQSQQVTLVLEPQPGAEPAARAAERPEASVSLQVAWAWARMEPQEGAREEQEELAREPQAPLAAVQVVLAVKPGAREEQAVGPAEQASTRAQQEVLAASQAPLGAVRGPREEAVALAEPASALAEQAELEAADWARLAIRVWVPTAEVDLVLVARGALSQAGADALSRAVCLAAYLRHPSWEADRGAALPEAQAAGPKMFPAEPPRERD